MLLNTRVPASYIFNKIRTDLMYVLVLSVIVFAVTEFYKHRLPELPLTIPTFIGTAISILLSFKLNQSYDRWWEARKVWGSIVNDSRSLVIQLRAFLSDENHPAVKKIAYRQIAWCYSLGQSLRGLNATENLQLYLSDEELETIEKHNNKPLCLLDIHSADIKELRRNNKLDIFSHVQLDNTLVRLCDAQGKCERIKSTIFPVTYRLFLHGMIYLFVITLSISLRNLAGYFELPLLLLISSSFFLLEKSASHMQDPFENRPTDTAVTAISRTIEINLKQLLSEEDVPQPLQPERFYLK